MLTQEKSMMFLDLIPLSITKTKKIRIQSLIGKKLRITLKSKWNRKPCNLSNPIASFQLVIVNQDRVNKLNNRNYLHKFSFHWMILTSQKRELLTKLKWINSLLWIMVNLKLKKRHQLFPKLKRFILLPTY